MNVTGYKKTETVRTMIGRIELISARQRKLLRQIAQGPVSNRGWFTEWLRANQPESNAAVYRLQQGTATFDEIGLQPTDDYQAYMDLGRFRDALIRHAIRYPVNSAKQSECVHVSGSVVKVRPPSAQTTKCDSIVISLPGDNRIINLGEMELYSGSRNVTQLASLSQSSNYQNRFPARNLVDGNETLLHVLLEVMHLRTDVLRLRSHLCPQTICNGPSAPSLPSPNAVPSSFHQAAA